MAAAAKITASLYEVVTGVLAIGPENAPSTCNANSCRFRGGGSGARGAGAVVGAAAALADAAGLPTAPLGELATGGDAEPLMELADDAGMFAAGVPAFSDSPAGFFAAGELGTAGDAGLLDGFGLDGFDGASNEAVVEAEDEADPVDGAAAASPAGFEGFAA
ncbi:MAG TPA: hypothetical protein VGE52_16660 [Pirellulales bacterium]